MKRITIANLSDRFEQYEAEITDYVPASSKTLTIIVPYSRIEFT